MVDSPICSRAKGVLAIVLSPPPRIFLVNTVHCPAVPSYSPRRQEGMETGQHLRDRRAYPVKSIRVLQVFAKSGSVKSLMKILLRYSRGCRKLTDV